MSSKLDFWRLEIAKNPQRSKGGRQFTIGMVLYVLIVLPEGFFREPETLSPVLGVVFAALPMIAALWAMLGWLSAIRTYDELQQRIYAEAGLISLGITAAVTFSYGFLELYIGAPRLSMFAVWPLIAAGYLFGTRHSRRHYR